MTPESFWNNKTPDQRLEYILKLNKKEKFNIGLSNAEKRYDKLTVSRLIDAIQLSIGPKSSSSKSEFSTGATASVSIHSKMINWKELVDEAAAIAESAVSDELDIVISFDDTGSMSSVRKQVRHNVNDLVKKLFINIPKLRVGCIIHNDYCDAPRHIFVQDFTSNRGEIEKFINRDSPCGGGDAPECYELALHEASKMSWKANRRALIMIGDEIPHELGYSYGSQSCRFDWKRETETLSNMNVKIYGVQALGSSRSRSFYEAISNMSGGIKLDLSQFQHISTYINAIAYHQAGQLDTYQASDPVFSTNIALKNMFTRLKGGSSTLSGDKIELLSKFQVMEVSKAMPIQDFVNANGCTFKRGKGYYSLIGRTADGKANSETIQANKEVFFVDRKTGEIIADTNWCRNQLGIPYGIKGTIRPLSIPTVIEKYEVFIQSNSYNRVLDPGCRFLYELEHK